MSGQSISLLALLLSIKLMSTRSSNSGIAERRTIDAILVVRGVAEEVVLAKKGGRQLRRTCSSYGVKYRGISSGIRGQSVALFFVKPIVLFTHSILKTLMSSTLIWMRRM